VKSIAGGGLVVEVVVVLAAGEGGLDVGAVIRTLVCGVDGDAGGKERSILVLEGFAREVEGIGVAAHFRLTASRVAELAAEALLEKSAICCDAGLEVDIEAVDPQL